MFAERQVARRQRRSAGRGARLATPTTGTASRTRRVCAAGLMMMSAVLGAVEPLPAPSGDVLLKIDGDIARANVDGQAHFDLAMLQALPSTAFTTDTPWDKGPQHFEGARLSALLDYVGAGSQSFQATAADDYTIRFTGIDLDRYPVIIAYRQDGAPISRRALGPLRIVVPFDDYPALNTYAGEALSIWQLLRISVL